MSGIQTCVRLLVFQMCFCTINVILGRSSRNYISGPIQTKLYYKHVYQTRFTGIITFLTNAIITTIKLMPTRVLFLTGTNFVCVTVVYYVDIVSSRLFLPVNIDNFEE